ncbi:MAG: hypothetical protein ACTSWN_03735 [Promethearchaeota archaeon]
MVFVVDFDGTINKMGERFDANKALIIEPMISAIQFLRRVNASDEKIIYLTGGIGSGMKEVTEKWLLHNGFPEPSSVIYFPGTEQDWTWPAYKKFKISTINEIKVKFYNSVVIVFDDNESIISELTKTSQYAFLIEDDKDWIEIFSLFFKDHNVPSQKHQTKIH